jgi:hypothetical protein
MGLYLLEIKARFFVRGANDIDFGKCGQYYGWPHRLST